MNNCAECKNIKFLKNECSGDFDSDIEDGIYKTDDGHYYWFYNCEDYWYSGFVHQVIYCPFCGRKIDD